jgi:hypothetical protein
MHFHLPKPLHGWRAFVGEVGIIVIGVLIALGAEQMVSALHQRQQAAEADSIIRSELDLNLGRLKSRMDIRSCVERRLEEIQAILDKAADEPGIATPSWIGRPQYWTFLSARWDAESQAGRTALIDPAKLAEYGMMYAKMRDLLNEMTWEQGDWAKLRTLEHVRRLDSSAAFELNQTLQDARYRNWRLALVSSQLFDQAKGLHLHASRNTTPASAAVCLPITTSRAEANRKSVWPFGEP